MKPQDIQLAQQFRDRLREYSAHHERLPGIAPAHAIDSLVAQMVDSFRRIKYVEVLNRRNHTSAVADPSSNAFNPIAAASFYAKQNNLDEASWLCFIGIYCGKHLRHGWRLARLLYGGGGITWTWARAASNPHGLQKWIADNSPSLRPDGNYAFGNHRKYETLKSSSTRSGTVALTSYIKLVSRFQNHQSLYLQTLSSAQNSPQDGFDAMYRLYSKEIISFGRIATFDHLTMLAKLRILSISPRIPYLSGSTGPLRGARLLFGGITAAKISARVLDEQVRKLGEFLGLDMQSMEDSLCNWQKSPYLYRRFNG